jgi:hypothetical protein
LPAAQNLYIPPQNLYIPPPSVAGLYIQLCIILAVEGLWWEHQPTTADPLIH